MDKADDALQMGTAEGSASRHLHNNSPAAGSRAPIDSSSSSDAATTGAQHVSSSTVSKTRTDRQLYVPPKRRILSTEGEASSAGRKRESENLIDLNASYSLSSSKTRPNRRLYKPPKQRMHNIEREASSAEKPSEQEEYAGQDELRASGATHTLGVKPTFNNAMDAVDTGKSSQGQDLSKKHGAKDKKENSGVTLRQPSSTSTDSPFRGRDKGKGKIKHGPVSADGTSTSPRGNKHKRKKGKGKEKCTTYPASVGNTGSGQAAAGPSVHAQQQFDHGSSQSHEDSSSATHDTLTGSSNPHSQLHSLGNEAGEVEAPKAKKKCRRRYRLREGRGWTKEERTRKVQEAAKLEVQKANTSGDPAEVPSDDTPKGESSTQALSSVSANRHTSLHHHNTPTPAITHYSSDKEGATKVIYKSDGSTMPADGCGRGRRGQQGQASDTAMPRVRNVFRQTRHDPSDESKSCYQTLPDSSRRTEGYQPHLLQGSIPNTRTPIHEHASLGRSSDQPPPNKRAFSRQVIEGRPSSPYQVQQKDHNLGQMQGHNTPGAKLATSVGRNRQANGQLQPGHLLKENRGAQNAATPTRYQYGQPKDGVLPPQKSSQYPWDIGRNRKDSSTQEQTQEQTAEPPNGSRSGTLVPHKDPQQTQLQAQVAANGMTVTPSPQMRSAVRPKFHLIPARKPDDILPTGNWDSSDAWAHPEKFDVPEDREISRHHIDFTQDTRLMKDVIIRVAHTVRDASGKQVIQRPLDPTSRVEYPELGKNRTPQQAIEQEGHLAFKSTNGESSVRPTPSAQPQLKAVDTQSTSTPHPQEGIESSETKPTMPSAQQKISTIVNPKNVPPHLRLPKPMQAQDPAGGKSEQSTMSELPPHLRPPKKDQLKATESHSNNESAWALQPRTTSLRVITPQESLSNSRRTANQPQLVTEGNAFLAQSTSIFNANHMQPVKSDTLATPAPTGQASMKAAEAKSASIEATSSNAGVPVGPSITQDTSQQESRGKEPAPRDNGLDTDAFHANLDVTILMTSKPAERGVSNASVRGRADEKLSSLSGSLDFEDTFQVRNPSEIYEKEEPVAPWFEYPHQKNQHENKLRGWDGEWAPPPIEWDLRELYDYSTPEHHDRVKKFIIDRIKEYRGGLCPPLKIDDEQFKKGLSLASGFPTFGKPIDDSEHEHIAAQDPFTLMKIHQTAAKSIENYNRANKTYEKREAERIREEEKAERKARRLIKEEEKESKALLPNPYKPEANMYIRPARVKDLPQVCNIFNHYVRTTAVTQERVEMTVQGWRSRHGVCETEKYPFIVAVHRQKGRTEGHGNEKIIGFAYAEDYSGENTMWRHTCELQLYVDSSYVRQGVGKNLVDCVMRGLNSLYLPKGGVQFVMTKDESWRHDNGGERTISHIIVPFSYVAHEEDSKWVGEWLIREFKFELQGTLKGIGRQGPYDKPVNLAYYVLETKLM
ncbi:MAG: hypothetical protein Q9181_005484 [Wetmoreana brouardii]